jgi:hypothetical protein
VRRVLKFLFGLSSGAIFCWMGEIILFALTFGKHKPRWDLYTDDSPSRFVVFSAEAMRPSEVVAKIQANFGLVQSGV